MTVLRLDSPVLGAVGLLALGGLAVAAYFHFTGRSPTAQAPSRRSPEVSEYNVVRDAEGRIENIEMVAGVGPGA